VFGNRVLRRIFGTKREELHNLFAGWMGGTCNKQRRDEKCV
jgi:hypothetical protein